MINFGEMHLITVGFIILELMMLTYQLHYYWSRPNDKSRFWYLILLCLLILYNIAGGLFPDPTITYIPVKTQNIIAYGTGFMMGSYFPFYFYKNFNLKTLRFQALYGVQIFLLLPYILFFVVFYTIFGNIEFAVHYGLVIPFFYSVYLLWAILSAIRVKFKLKKDSLYPVGRFEIIGVCCAVFPWVSLSAFAYFDITQWIEVLVTNLGLVFLTITFMVRSAAKARIEDRKLLTMLLAKEVEFQKYCLKYRLTMQQERVAELLCKGYSYQEIASTLFVSRKTVDTHIQHIFLKTGANRKFQLMQKLGFVEIDYSPLKKCL